MAWSQTIVRLRARPRGFHLVTAEIIAAVPQIRTVRTGLMNLLLQHTSASLTLNENADPDVRGDLDRWLDRVAPADEPYYAHTCEGSDDMPAHVKSSLMGTSLTIPISDGHLALGTWQGIWLGEHRDMGGSRTICTTVWGE
jgi:secondary thiamine-phosphate synthase enzyme